MSTSWKTVKDLMEGEGTQKTTVYAKQTEVLSLFLIKYNKII